MAKAKYNPFDPYAIPDEPTGPGVTMPYLPSPVAGVGATDTGIPEYVPPEAGGFTGGVEPGGYHPPTNSYPDPPGASPSPSPAPAPAAPAAPAAPTYSQYAMPGWDQTKWADPNHTTIKYQAGRIFSQFDPNAIRANPAPLLAALKSAGLNPTMIGDDKIDFGDGYGPIDVITSGGQWAWQPTTGGPATAPQPVAPGVPGGAATPSSLQSALYTAAQQALTGGGTSSSTSSATSGPDPALSAAVKAMVMKLMGQSPTDVSTSPVYQGSIKAYDLQQQRNADKMKNAIAERMAAEGTANSGGMSDRLLGAEQAAGEKTAGFVGELSVRELTRQRDEIMQALQIGAGMMTDEERLALSEKLGLINAALNQQQIGNQYALGQGQLGLGQQQVTNQNNQFNSSLGWQMAQWPAQQSYLAWLMSQGGA